MENQLREIEMKEKIDKRNIEAFTYEIEDQKGLKLFIKKVIRKMILWMLKPIGEKQNDLNRQFYVQTKDMEETLAGLKDQIERYRTDLDYVMSKRNHNLLFGELSAANDVNVMDDIKLNEQIRFLKENKSESVEQQLSQIQNIFQSDIENSLLQRKMQDVILILCFGLKRNSEVEAIRKEALDLYTVMRRWSRYYVQMVSVEEQESIEYQGNIAYVPEELLEKYFAERNIKLVVLLESNISIVYRARSLFFKYKLIVRLTGQDPLMGVEPDHYEHTRHLNDMGFQRYDVYSKKAQNLMKEAGFKNVNVKYPVIDTSVWKYKKRDVNEKTVIGLASSPMGKEQWIDRGMDLLTEVMSDNAECEFEILWRSEQIPVQEEWMHMEHCKVLYGRQDMQAFYDRIDLLLIPYVSIENNHACSFSALEAMLQGIPVIATKVSGIADLIDKFGIGEVCGTTSSEIKMSIQKIKNHYDEYSGREKALLLKQEISETNLVVEMERYAEAYLPKNITTIGEWRRDLESAGKNLVKGPSEIKAYYSQFEIAENYNKDRFIQFPENCIDLLERTSIGSIIKDRFRGEDINILDIAPGDGRIMQENLKYGECLGADSSEEMLRILKKRFENFDNLETKKMDYFEDKIERQFDVITTFRYIRHFEYFQRKVLYKKIKRNLTPKGILIFDVPNIKFEMPVRNQNGWDKYNIYDIFMTKEEMVAEMKENGFNVEYVIAIGNNLMENIPEECVNEPITWTFGVTKAR